MYLDLKGPPGCKVRYTWKRKFNIRLQKERVENMSCEKQALTMKFTLSTSGSNVMMK